MLDPTYKPKDPKVKFREHHTGRIEARKTIKTIAGSKRVSGWGSTEQEAEADLAEVLLQYQLPTAEQLKNPTLSRFTNNHYVPTAANKSKKWREQILWALKHIYPVLGNRPIAEITRHELQMFLDSKLKPRGTLSRGSVAHLKKVLHAILDLAEADDVVTKNAARKLVLPKPAPKRREVLSAQEIMRMIEHTRGYDSAHATAVIGGLCGLRVGEIINLRSRPKGAVLEVSGTKTDAAIRDLPILPEIVAELSKTSFPISKSGSNIRRGLIKAAARAGIAKPVNPHAFRHAFVTGLERLGCPVEVRARLAGHGKRGATAIYSHAELEVWRDWMARWVAEVYCHAGGENGGELQKHTP